MPIKDRTRRRLPRLGVIRLGLLVDNARGSGQHPIQTDYFVLKDAPDIADFYAAQDIEKVRELNVRLPFRELERNFDAWYQVWANGVLVCQGDGEYVQYATPTRVEVKKTKGGEDRTHVYNANGATLVSNGVAQVAFDWGGTHLEPGEIVPCPGGAANLYPQCAACKLGALLKVMMADPDLFRFGYYQISTGSKRNYDTIMGTLELMPPGQVNAVPFKLRLVEEQITFQEGGKRKKTTKWFLQLEPDPAITRQIYQQRTAALLGAPRQAPPEIPASAGPEWVDLDEETALPPPFVEVGADAATGYEGGDHAPETGEPPLEPRATNRPYAPETVKAKMVQLAQGQHASASQAQVQLIAGKLNECFAGDPDADRKRHGVTNYLFGFESSKNLHTGHVDALLKWLLLDSEKDDTGDYPLHASAPAEAAAIVKAALIDAGQAEMNLFDTEADPA